MLDSFEKKYINGRGKTEDVKKLELIILEELGHFRRDLYDLEGSLAYYHRALAVQIKCFPSDVYQSGKIQLNMSILLLQDDVKNNNN